MMKRTDVTLPSGAMLIGDEWVKKTSKGTYQHIYAADGRPDGEVVRAGAEEVNRAVESAWKAQREWMSWTIDARRDALIHLADVVHEHGEELTALNVEDYAVPIQGAGGHAQELERFLRYYAGWVDKGWGANAPASQTTDDFISIEREPYGVIGAIVPWNGPLFVIGLNVAPALAAGNAVLIKTPGVSPYATLRFGELCLEAGLPAGLVNIVTGRGDSGELIVRHPGVRKVHFTGGEVVARQILNAATENLTPVATELGGKAANIIFDDANLDAAATLAAYQGPLGQSGQSCACGSRILVQDGVYDDFMQRFIGVVENAPIGDPWDPRVAVGPVSSEEAMNRILGIIEESKKEHVGRLVTGGERVGGDLADGYFIRPTVFEDVPNDSPLAQVETFGPVVSVMRFHDDDEAVRIANDTHYGLNDFLYTNNLVRARRVTRQLEAGSVWVNAPSDIVPQGPYGGYKQSGVGRAAGREGLDEFLQVKMIRLGMPGAVGGVAPHAR